MVGDPAGIGDQCPNLVVHRGGTAQNVSVNIAGVQLAAADARRAQGVDRGQKALKPYGIYPLHHGGILGGGREEVRSAVAALDGREPPRRQLIIVQTHTPEIAFNTAGVTQRVVVIPYGRSIEFIVSVLVRLIGQKEGGGAAVPVLAQLVDQIHLCQTVKVDIVADIGGIAAELIIHGIEFVFDISAHGGNVRVAAFKLGGLHCQVVAVLYAEMEVVGRGRRVDLGHKGEIGFYPAGGGIKVVLVINIGHKGVLAHIDLLAHLIGTLIGSVGIQIDKTAVGRIGYADRVGHIIQNTVARHRRVLKVRDERELFALLHAGDRDRLGKGDVKSLFVGVPRGVAAAFHFFDVIVVYRAVALRDRAGRGDGILFIHLQISKEIDAVKVI